jgi:hypothetical protein
LWEIGRLEFCHRQAFLLVCSHGEVDLRRNSPQQAIEKGLKLWADCLASPRSRHRRRSWCASIFGRCTNPETSSGKPGSDENFVSKGFGLLGLFPPFIPDKGAFSAAWLQCFWIRREFDGKVLPEPSVLSTQILPPIRWTIWRAWLTAAMPAA